MSAARAWVVRDLGERTEAARAARRDVLRNPGPRSGSLPGRLARASARVVTGGLAAAARTSATAVGHAAHRVVVKLSAANHTAAVASQRRHGHHT
jgi:hypothetical protein